MLLGNVVIDVIDGWAPAGQEGQLRGHGCATYNFLHMSQGLVIPAGRRFGRVRWGHNDLQAGGGLKAQKAERPLAKMRMGGADLILSHHPDHNGGPSPFARQPATKIHCTPSTTVMEVLCAQPNGAGAPELDEVWVHARLVQCIEEVLCLRSDSFTDQAAAVRSFVHRPRFRVHHPIDIDRR